MIQDRVCKVCGRSFRGGPRAFYCPECRYTRQRDREAGYRKNGSKRPLGSIDLCERCSKEYTVVSGLQRFCPECRPIHTTEYDRETSLEFYAEYKDRINQIRNPRRQQGMINCEWCGKEFISHNRSRACSPECRRELKNKWWRDMYHKRRSQ
jgi:uncharacterized Zn ribbon protein